jgi:hypothetical protein
MISGKRTGEGSSFTDGMMAVSESAGSRAGVLEPVALDDPALDDPTLDDAALGAEAAVDGAGEEAALSPSLREVEPLSAMGCTSRQPSR